MSAHPESTREPRRNVCVASRARRLGTLVVSALIVLALAAVPAGAARPISGAAAFTLPAATNCLAKRELSFQLRKVSHVKWSSLTVTVNGKRVLLLKKPHVPRTIVVPNLPEGKLAIALTAKSTGRRTASMTRTYETCAKAEKEQRERENHEREARERHEREEHEREERREREEKAQPAPGRYAAGDPQSRSGQEMSFYVSPAGNLQDVIVTNTFLECAPGEPIADTLYLPEVTVTNGSFSGELQKEEIIKGVKAKVTYVLSGSESGSTPSGSMREDIVYNDGLEHKCSTNTHSWTGVLETGQSALSLPGAEGSYNGEDPQSRSGQALTFYVASSGNLQDVAVTNAFLYCDPKAEVADRFELPEVTVKPDGSFTGEKEVEGLFEQTPAKFVYQMSGHVHGAGATGEPRVTGIFDERITYNNGTQRTCATNDAYFKAGRVEQQGAKSLPAQEGRYSAGDPQSRSGQEMSFYISPAGNVEDVAVANAFLECSPGEAIADGLYIGEVHVNADGSFTGEDEHEAILKGVPAHFAYVISGHVHGTAVSGEQEIDGTFRDTVSYNDGTEHTCSTNNHYFMATRDEKQSPLSLPLDEGPFSAADPQSRSGQAMTFTGTSGGDLSKVIVTDTFLQCDPKAEVVSEFELPTVTVEGDGSFDAERETTGVFEKAAATFVFKIRGHVHGAGSNGEPRVTGIFSELITYDNGTSHTCSTGNVFWAGART